MYLKGRAHYRRHGISQENATARALFEKALELDPDLSPAYIWVAWTHYMEWRLWGFRTRKPSTKRKFGQIKQRHSGENNADMQFLLSRIAFSGEHAMHAALAHMERALELNPNDAEIIANYGLLLIYVSRSAESIPLFKKAMRLNPHYRSGWISFLGFGYYYTKRYNDAVEVIVRKRKLNISDHRLLAATYAQLGRLDKARTHVNEILKIDPEFTLPKLRKYLQKVFKNENDIGHIIGGLRNAGLPERPPLPLPEKPSVAVLPLST